MFLITETEAAAIQQALLDDGELSAAIELRRRFPGIDNLVAARCCVRALTSALRSPELSSGSEVPVRSHGAPPDPPGR